MALIPGTNVGAPVVPYDTADTYPSHRATYGQGGLRAVANTAARLAIPLARQELGMFVYEEDTGDYYKLNTLPGSVAGNWSLVDFSGTTPHRIIDADGDTYIDVELTPDDDTVRIANGGTEWINITTSGAGALWKMRDGVAAGEAGASLTIEAGGGTDGVANSGDITFKTFPGHSGGDSGYVRLDYDGYNFGYFLTNDHGCFGFASRSNAAASDGAFMFATENEITSGLVANFINQTNSVFSVDYIGQITLGAWGSITTAPQANMWFKCVAVPAGGDGAFIFASEEDWSSDGTLLACVDDLSGAAPVKFSVSGLGALQCHDWFWAEPRNYPTKKETVLISGVVDTSDVTAFILAADQAIGDGETLLSLGDNYSLAYDEKFRIDNIAQMYLENWASITTTDYGAFMIWSAAIDTTDSPVFGLAAQNPIVNGYLLSIADNIGGTPAEKFKISAKGEPYFYNWGSITVDANGTVRHWIDPTISSSGNKGYEFVTNDLWNVSDFTGKLWLVGDNAGSGTVTEKAWFWSDGGLKISQTTQTDRKYHAVLEVESSLGIDLKTGLEYHKALFNFTNPTQRSVGNIALQRDFAIYPTTHAFSGASTIYSAFTFHVGGPALPGTGCSITHNYTSGIYGRTISGVFDVAAMPALPNAMGILLYNNTVVNTSTAPIGFYADAYASGSSMCYGVMGAGQNNNSYAGAGVVGIGRVSNTWNAANSLGVYGYAGDTHAGGTNIGVYGVGFGGLQNFAFAGIGDFFTAGRVMEYKGSDVASAANITLSIGNYFDITGTTTIYRINESITNQADWEAGSLITLQFDAAVTVRHGEATSGTYRGLRLAGATHFNATAGDTLTLRFDGTYWREVARAVI